MQRFDRWFRKFYQVVDDNAAGGAGGGDTAAAEALKKAAFERDNAKAAEAKLRREIEEIKRSLPNEERLKEIEEALKFKANADEEKQRKAGEFEAMRKQDAERHTKETQALKKQIEEAEAKAKKEQHKNVERLIGLSFADATEWFGESGKTKYWPEEARAVLGRYVDVVTDEDGTETVVVKDLHGTVLTDMKANKPMPFGKAIGELIDSLPNKNQVLKGSGKVGSGSAGGGHGSGSQIDLGRLKPSDFNDPKVREAVKRQQADAGGLVFGPTLQKLAERK
jgi:hypothetical protein